MLVYCMQLLFSAILDMSATHRLNKAGLSTEPFGGLSIEPFGGLSIEPFGTLYLAVRKGEQFDWICTKCCLCFS